MNTSEIFEAEGDGSENEYTLFSLASEFLEAACVLQEIPPVRVNYKLVTYYLLGHSAELMLKAYLHKHGLSIQDLRKNGHDLEKLIKLAKEKGLPEKMELKYILCLANIYKNKNLEYRQQKKIEFPPVPPVDFLTEEILTEEIKSLQSAVFEKIFTI